jgi:hypothetical protein
MIYVGNAFSLNMLQTEKSLGEMTMRVEWVSLSEVKSYLAGLDFVSAIGHKDTAAVVSGLIGYQVPENRISVDLREGDLLIVAQYSGPRLPEGATSLPEGATIEFFRVRLQYRRHNLDIL